MADDIGTLLRRTDPNDEQGLRALCSALVRRGYSGAFQVLGERWQALVETIAAITDWQHDHNGQCPTRSEPLARDPACQVCNLLLVAERADPRVWRAARERVVTQAAVVERHDEHYEAERRRRYRAEREAERLREELARLRRQLGT